MKKEPHKKPAHWRHNYEDHSLKFLDWVDHLGLERTWFGRFIIILEKKFQIRRLAFIFLFSIVLAFVITFEFHSDLDFKLGELTKFDVISPISFEMVDEVTTEEKRVKAEMSVPVIFDYDPNVFDKVSNGIYRSFRLMRLKLRNIQWPKSALEKEEVIKDFIIHKGEFEKELSAEIPNHIFEWLVHNKFSARIENILIKNLEIWLQRKIADDADKYIPVQQSMILSRVVQKNNSGREFNIRKGDIIDISQSDTFELKDLSGFDKAKPFEVNYMQHLAQLLLVPNLTLNKQEIASRRQTSREAIIPILISVKKNQTIIPAGTVIQPIHMAILKEIQVLKSDRRQDIMMVAIAFLFLFIIIVFFQYLKRFARRVRVETKDIFVMGIVTLGTVILAKIYLFSIEATLIVKFGAMIPAAFFLYSAPFAAGPMLVGLLIQSGEVVWLFTAFMALVCGVLTEMNFATMLVVFVGGIAAARGVYSCKTRNDIYWAGFRTGIVNALVIGLVVILSKLDHDTFSKELFVAIPAGFLAGILSSFITMIVIPLLESMFNYTTDVRLLELSNLNHPLLKEMIVKAPGTYHHSMLVGSMVEAAAEEITANPLLAKVMCYYHDIGKMEHSNYFIENQKPGHNPHDHISPYMSKTLLIAHVKDGVELGMSYKLGQPIIDGIIQHHGTTLIAFFYNKALDLKAAGEGEVSEEEFRYPGPRPQFREAALCMLADSIEAAARSLDEPTPARLQNIVRSIVQRKFMEGQLDDCSLTLKDLSKVENAFIRILLGIYHQRIDYPKAAGGITGDRAPIRGGYVSGKVPN